jgi:hypothetical protein
MNNFTSRLCDPEKDQDAVTDMLYAIKDDLCLANREAARKIATLCFEKGGVIGVYDGALLCSMGGFFYGEPEQDFSNKEVGFIYVAGILPDYRLSRVFFRGLVFTLQAFAAIGFQEFRLQARASDPYTNGLYGRFAARLGEGKSLRGDPVITYGGPVDDALAFLQRGMRWSHLARRADSVVTAVP